MAEVIEVNDIHKLASYRLATNALLANTPRVSFVHTLDWLEAYWHHAGEGRHLRALIVRAGGQTIGFVPLVVETRWTPLGPLRMLTYPSDSASGWQGPLGANQAATLTLAARHLAESSHDWDLINLSGVDHEGADRGRTLRALQGVGWGAAVQPAGEVAQIEFGDGFETYLIGRSAKMRYELRVARQAMHKLGRVEFVRHRPEPFAAGDGDPRWDLYDAHEAVAANAGPSVDNRLLRDAHSAAARQGAIDLCLLKIDGHPVASAYGYAREGRLSGLRLGFNLEVNRSVDLRTAMVGWMIEEGYRRGDERIELDHASASAIRPLVTNVAHPWRVMSAPLGSLRARAAMLGGALAQRWTRRAS